MGNIKIQIFVTGKVQGVGYRLYIATKAQNLGITGWIKNNSDGSVEGVFEGEEDLLKKIIEWCKEGPPFAQVDNVEVYSYSYNGTFKDFKIMG